jgi:hypothetical protein
MKLSAEAFKVYKTSELGLNQFDLSWSLFGRMDIREIEGIGARLTGVIKRSSRGKRYIKTDVESDY